MNVCILKGKFYLVISDDVYGWYGMPISSEQYDALKGLDFDDKCKPIGDTLYENNLINDYGIWI